MEKLKHRKFQLIIKTKIKMKKIIFYTLSILFGVIILESFGSKGLGKKEGTEPGYTGSPGDSLKNCTACHGGTAVTVSDWITSNIPASGYTPGNTYTLTATNTELGATRFGFSVSPQALNGSLLGTLVITDTTNTKLVGNDLLGNNKYVTYKAAGVPGENSRFWTFDWIAPSKGTGDVVFYGAFNSNFEGHKDGDKTFLSTLRVKESGTSSISKIANNNLSFSFYPNPSKDWININYELKTASNLVLDIIDINGKQVTVLLNERQLGIVTKQFNTAQLANGNYFIRLQANGQIAIEKLNVNH